MGDRDRFASVLLKHLGISLLLYIVLCLPSFLTVLNSGFGILGWEQYYQIMLSSLFQNTYFSELYIRLGGGWLPNLILLAMIISSLVISQNDRGVTPETGSRMILTVRLFMVNVAIMAILAPLTFVEMLNGIGILTDRATARFRYSDFIATLYGNDYSWTYVYFPFLIASPIILSVCAHAWYKPTASATALSTVVASDSAQTAKSVSSSEHLRTGEHKAWMIVGGVVIAIGVFLLSSHTTFYEGGSYYGSIYIGGSVVWSKTLGLMAVKFVVLGGGYLAYRHGQNMRDAR